MPVNLPPIRKDGTTKTRKDFWDDAWSSVMESQKLAGRHTSVSEYPGKGTVINVADSSTRRGGGPGSGGLGACCIGTDCTIRTPSDCAANGGTYYGNGVGCTPGLCAGPPTGACCNTDTHECSITTAAGCVGNFLGIGTTCEGVDCTTGACCQPDGSCTVTTPGACFGIFQGEGTTCTPNPCPQPTGACCLADGTCETVTATQCTTDGGTYQGDGTTCSPNPCPPAELGACCVGGVCSQTTAASCTGVFQGVGVPCTPDPCTACPSCAFFNSVDGRYYLVKNFHASGTYHNDEGSGTFLNAAYSSVRTDTCSVSGLVCSGGGTGTIDLITSSGPFCHCDETLGCNDPIVAFGFFGGSDLAILHESCDNPSCQGAFAPQCIGTVVCTYDSSTDYAVPCIHS